MHVRLRFVLRARIKGLLFVSQYIYVLLVDANAGKSASGDRLMIFPSELRRPTSLRINCTHRVVIHIGVEVWNIYKAGRILRNEPSQLRVVETGAVVEQTGIGVAFAAGGC